jgi:uncharacterized surface anchored protein
MRIRLGRDRARRKIALVAGICLLGGAASVALPSSASPLSGSSFEEGDGNLVVDTTKDWANAGIGCVGTPKVGCALDKETGQTDDAFGEGTSENDPVPSVVAGSIPNNKSDLLRFYLAQSKENQKDFLHLAWERVQEPNGTTNMDFEFNQSQTVSSNGITKVRTAGDILVKYDLGASSTPVLGYHVWVTTGSAAALCQAGNKLPCWGKVQTFNSSQANGSVNTAVVTDPIAPDAPRDLSVKTFGEASINLSDTVFAGRTDCVSFGSAYLKSRSSDSFTAALKDFIAPLGISVTNCGGINIHKVNDVGTPLQGVTFTLFKDNAPLGGVAPRGAEDVAVVPANTCTTNALGNCSLPNVPFGQYWVAETTTPAGHNPAPDQNVVVNALNTSHTLTFVNQRNPATIILHKEDDIGDSLGGAVFTLYTNVAPTSGPRTDDDTITTSTCTSNAEGDCTISGILVPGDYWIVETGVPVGHDRAADRAVTVALGQTLDITSAPFVNPRRPASVKLNKVDDTGSPLQGAVFTLYSDVAPTGAPRGAGDTATAFSCTSAANGDCTISDILPAGDYLLAETETPAGHDPVDDIAITLSLGQNLDMSGTPLVDNRRPASITLHKEDDTGAALQGALFTLHSSLAPFGASPGTEDVATGFTCTSEDDGRCTISGILPAGEYWVVETTAPAGYTKAAPRLVTVALDQDLDIAVPFVNPRQAAEVLLTKQDDTGAPLGGAVFTLFTDNSPTGGTRGDEDTITAFTCTSAASDGACTISNILPAGAFWIVETVTPDGYSTAAELSISLSLNQTLDLRSEPVVNNRIPASIKLHKEDDTGADLGGAIFSLYANNAPTGGVRGDEDTLTAFTCTSGADGDCLIEDILPAGSYWIVETTTPTGYTTAADRSVTVALGEDLDITNVPFVNVRKFTVIVLVCRESNNTLHQSTVTVDGVEKASLGTSATPDPVCATGGARYAGKEAGNHPASVNIP